VFERLAGKCLAGEAVLAMHVRTGADPAFRVLPSGRTAAGAPVLLP
jgi:hypothetical protein